MDLNNPLAPPAFSISFYFEDVLFTGSVVIYAPMNIDYEYYVSLSLIDSQNNIFAFVADLSINPTKIYVRPGIIPFEGALGFKLVLGDTIGDKIKRALTLLNGS